MGLDPVLLDYLAQHPAWQAAQAQQVQQPVLDGQGVSGGQIGGEPLPPEVTVSQEDPNAPVPDATSSVAPVQPASPPPVGPAPTGAVQGAVSAEHRGLSTGTLDELGRRGKGVQADMAAAGNAARAGETPEMARVQAASALGEKALGEQTTAQMGQAGAQEQGDIVLSRLQSHLGAIEKVAAAHAQQQTAMYRANLEADLAKARALRVNSGQLFRDMTGGERLGTAVSLFAQGFLGSRGIQTGAREALSYWVDRSVSDQESAIRQGQQLAENDKMLWDMARTQSHDDQEARDRVGAYLTAQAQMEVKATTDAYGSALAKANGDAAVAALQQDLNAKMATITDRYDQKAHQASQQVLDLHKMNLMASIEEGKLGIEQKRYELEKAKVLGGAKVFPIFDTSPRGRDPNTGQARSIGTLKPEFAGLKNAGHYVELVNNSLSNASELATAFEKYQTLANETGRVLGDVPLSKALRTDAGNRLVMERSSLIGPLARAMFPGARITQKELDIAGDLIPLDTRTGMTLNAVNQVISDRIGEAIKKSQIQAAYYYDPSPTGQYGTGGVIGPGGPGGEDMRNADMTANPQPPQTSGVQYLGGELMVPGSKDSVPDQDAWRAFNALTRIAEGGYTYDSGRRDAVAVDPMEGYRGLAATHAVPGPMRELMKGPPDQTQQQDAWKILSAYELGLVKGGTNETLRANATQALGDINKERESVGLDPFPTLTAKDLAGYELDKYAPDTRYELHNSPVPERPRVTPTDNSTAGEAIEAEPDSEPDTAGDD